jgi:CubicO group peptidase (beta-lactamase class C family)
VLDYITFAKPIFAVGTNFSYSNLGFLLLGQIIANVSKKPLDKYF